MEGGSDAWLWFAKNSKLSIKFLPETAYTTLKLIKLKAPPPGEASWGYRWIIGALTFTRSLGSPTSKPKTEVEIWHLTFGEGPSRVSNAAPAGEVRHRGLGLEHCTCFPVWIRWWKLPRIIKNKPVYTAVFTGSYLNMRKGQFCFANTWILQYK